MRIQTYLILPALLVCTSLQAQPLEFKGVPFGATKPEFQAAQPQFRCDMGTDCFATGNADIYAGVPASITAQFTDGKLSIVRIGFKSMFHTPILAALTAKYGEATTVKASEYRTQGGAVATNDEREWRLADGGVIVLNRFGSAITEGYALLMSAEGQKARALGLQKLKDQALKGI